MLRLRHVAVLAALSLLPGCKKPEEKVAPGPTAAAAPAPAKPGSPSLSRAAGIKADKTAGQDGPLTGDSADDGVLTLSIDGPISALAVVSVDAAGAISGSQQRDTVVEQQVQPAGWKSLSAHGADTWQVGVEEGGKMLNTKTGALAPLGAGPHKLTLYVGDASHFTSGTHYMVLAERPDHTVVKSNVLTM
jgi:hypothetical protein